MPQIRVSLSDDNQSVHELTEDTITIGRLADNSIQIEDGSVSSHHAEISFEGGQYRLLDKGSTNGTFVNGEAATEAVLKDGDQVRFGSIDTVFVGDAVADASSPPLPRTERAVASAGSASARPGVFQNSSPFPKPKPKTDALTYAALGLAALGALGFLAAVVLSISLSAPSTI